MNNWRPGSPLTATLTLSLGEWLGSQVPDNLKTGVVRPCRYEPLLHRSYQEMAEHYGTAIIPARIKKPRDKAKVEVGVQIAERQILAALRDQRFFSVGELNAAISPLLTKLNAQPFQKLEGSRNSWFETQEKGQLLPLPATPFELANWSQAKVNIDYHVAVEKHFYSAPHQLVHQQLDVRLTDKTVELFQHGKRVAAIQQHLIHLCRRIEQCRHVVMLKVSLAARFDNRYVDGHDHVLRPGQRFEAGGPDGVGLDLGPIHAQCTHFGQAQLLSQLKHADA